MIESILDECLEEIRAGRATVAACLARYPEYADDLKPLLEVALALEQVPDVKPSEEFKRSTRELLSRAGETRSSSQDGKVGDARAADSTPGGAEPDREGEPDRSKRPRRGRKSET